MARGRGVNSALIRQLNAARVFHALRLEPGASQRELAERTGIDPATISAIVTQFGDSGWLEREARPSSGRAGRPEVSLRIAPDAGTLVGARLEPREIRLLAATLAGERLAERTVPGTVEPERAVRALASGVAALLDETGRARGSVRGIGVGVPALMDRDGHLAFAPNLGWRDVPLDAMLRAELGRALHRDPPPPLYVDNDTKAAGLAETLFGSCRDVHDHIVIAAHSGVGGALYLGGRLYRGRSGYGGEIGHLKVRRGGRPCACGGRGCLEAYLSETALLADAAEAGLDIDDLASLAGVAEAGDERARAVLERAGEILGEACADLINLLSPQRIVLGGNLAWVAGAMLPAVERAVEAHALPAAAERCAIRVSPLGAASVPMGGVALAMEGFLSLPSWLVASQALALAPTGVDPTDLAG